jgi:hypothetical protein
MLALGIALLWGCSPAPDDGGETVKTDRPGLTESTPGSGVGQDMADVISVQVSGGQGAYRFSVEVKSPDEGCDRYADWWEVVSQDGELIYRRVLLHSHTDEQPFTRSGGPVEIQEDEVVWVRAHMNTGGYGGQALKGSVASGFENAAPGADFAANLAQQPPLPEDCAF